MEGAMSRISDKGSLGRSMLESHDSAGSAKDRNIHADVPGAIGVFVHERANTRALG